MNYTSIEQSKKLLELGLSLESADMCYWMQYHRAIDGGGQHLEDKPSTGKGNKGSIPCWSVGSLLEWLENHVYVKLEHDGIMWTLKVIDHDNSSITYYNTQDYIIDVCYNVIIWLLKNGTRSIR